MQCRLAPGAGTMPLWPPRRWLWRCANGPGGCGLARGSCWSHQSRCLTHSKDPPLATPTFVVFLRGFYWHLCLCIPHNPSCSRTLAHSAGGGPQHRPWRPGSSPLGPLHEHLVSAAVLRHWLTPCLGRTWHLFWGHCHHRHRWRPLGRDSLQNKKTTTKKTPTLMQKKEKENVLFMYLFIWFVWDRFFFLSLFIWGVSFLVSGSSQETS